MRAVRTISWLLLFVAVGAAAASWFTPEPDVDVSEADAVATALGALAAAGHPATVAEPVVRSGHVADDGAAIDVHVVFADVDGARVEVRVLTDTGQLAYVDDRIGPGGAERLLTDEEFAVMDAYDHGLGRDAWVRRNGSASGSALLVAVVCFLLATRADLLRGENP